MCRFRTINCVILVHFKKKLNNIKKYSIKGSRTGMKIGDIFKSMFGKNPRDLTLEEIENLAVKKANYHAYAAGLVSKRGNVFKNRHLNLDKLVDDSLQKPLSTLR